MFWLQGELVPLERELLMVSVTILWNSHRRTFCGIYKHFLIKLTIIFGSSSPLHLVQGHGYLELVPAVIGERWCPPWIGLSQGHVNTNKSNNHEHSLKQRICNLFVFIWYSSSLIPLYCNTYCYLKAIFVCKWIQIKNLRKYRSFSLGCSFFLEFDYNVTQNYIDEIIIQI